MRTMLSLSALALVLVLPVVASVPAAAQKVVSPGAEAPKFDAGGGAKPVPSPGAEAPKFDAGGGAKPAEEAAKFRTLDEDVQDLKKRTVELNRDLFQLEEALLFPANTQVAVFVSMDVGQYFALDSIQLKVDGKDVTNYLYTEREVGALMRGGVQRLYVGNVRAGDHELVAVFTGRGPNDRDYKRGASLKFKKDIGPKYIELTISDKQTKLQPEFLVKEWE